MTGVAGDAGADWLRTVEGRPTDLEPEARERLQRARRARRRSGALSPLAYNLTISHTHRFVWFRNPKVATRSLLELFDETIPDEQLSRLSLRPYPTLDLAGYFKFGFVRHPLDRFVSVWQNKVLDTNGIGVPGPVRRRNRDIVRFAEWVAEQDLRDPVATDRHLVLQTRLVDLSQVDFVGRMETLDRDVATVCERVGLPRRRPPRRNASTPAVHGPDGVPDEVRRLVEEVYALDYQVLGY